MATFNELRDRISGDIERSSAADLTKIENAINDAIEEYQSTRFFFNESRSVTFNTVASQSDYTFGSGGDITTEFYRIDGVYLTENGNVRELTQVDYQEIERVLDSNSTDNRPHWWAYVNEAMRLYPQPDAAYSIRITGHIKLAAPTGDNDNAWTIDAFNLIRCCAKKYLAAHVFEDDEGAVRMALLEKRALDKLTGQAAAKTGTGRITPTTF